MEYCPYGSISNKCPFTYEKFIQYAKQLLEALQYCHSMKIAHRDIKPDNIFIDQYDNVKLGDFGLSKHFDDKRKSSQKCGSLMFFAPEMFRYSEYSPFEADIWALGITFFMMATGNRPYKTNTLEELKNFIIYGVLDFGETEIDPQIRYLINKMTNKNPKLRPKAEKLLKLPMFSPIAAKKQSIILNSKKASYTTGYSFQANLLYNKTNNLCQNQDLDATSDKKQNEILIYRNISPYPNIQRIRIRNISKPI